ncbi:MAG TPA: hypothetical protein VKJ83_02390 [Actinomycetota bacterium]|nr:hypothetical protein [Actinomycetota bacterium]
MDWAKQGDVLPPASAGDPDHLRAWEPWVLEEDDGTLRMWYSGNDGTTSRILEAVRPTDGPWERLGVAVDAGLAGDSDRYGVEAACVVKFDEGYLMVYGGFDGRDNCLHLARSPDGHRWTADGPIVSGETRPLARWTGGVPPTGAAGAAKGSTPSLFIGGDQWWLFYSAAAGSEPVNGSEGSNGSRGSHRTAILAAVSKPGGGWDPVGSVLQPERGEVATSHPCVVEISRTLYMFYASENEQRSSIALATSADGLEWERRGIVVSGSDDDADTWAVTAPCVARLRDGSVRMWYSRRPWGDDQLAYAIGSAVFPGPLPGSR